MTTWLVILAVGAGSYVLRAVPLVLGARSVASPGFERTSGHAGTAALAALVGAGFRTDAAGAGDAVAFAVAVVVALVVSLRGGSLPRVLLAGGIAHAAVSGALWLVS